MTWREAGLLLLWAKRVKFEEELEIFFEEMFVYMEKQWKDEEEKEKIYPFTVILYSQILEKKKDYKRINEMCKKAIACILIETQNIMQKIVMWKM